MADKRTIKFEIAVDADTKGVDRFNKVLRDLENAAPIAESELRKVRQGILEFSQQSGTSATSLKALETALTKLQSEARGGSALWKTLGGDIAGVRQQIGELTGTIRSAEQAQKDLNRALNAPVGNTFGKLAEQTGKLKNELRDLNYRSQEYIRTLTRVKELETVGSFQQGRLNTIAANQAFMGATLSRGYGASANLPGLPDTLAGDAQRVSELSERIRNLDRGSELYLQTVKELAAANDQLARSQREYNRELAGTAEIERRRTVEGAAQSRLSLADRAAELRRERQQFERDAAQRARGEALLLSQADGRSTISSGRNSLSLSAAAAEQRRRRREFEREARVRAAEDLITANQTSGRRTIESGRDTLSLSSRAAELRQQRQQREQEAAQRAASNAIFERQAEARSRTSQASQRLRILGLSTQPNDYFDGINARAAAERERIRQAAERRQAEAEQERVRARSAYMRRLRNAGEISTAVGVAGYFGGPEAVAGAAAGAIFGPGGAQVGTTLGLAAGGLRQQVAGFSDQAAQLNKLQISLKSIAGSESEYTRAMNAITSANREFNIPLLEGTRAMTQLTAAVKGAGGTVADAELAYRGITAAIKATGGSSADAEGAIRALVQTFSKSKISAEEIRQQLAERLPGAVTLFAQATGRTGAELDKAFEKGQVGLNDLMKFLATLNTRYSETARRLAASNDEAGLRFQLRWEQTTLAIGEAFKPLGAEIQNSLIEVLKTYEGPALETIRSLTTSVKALAGAFELIARNKDAALTIAGFVAQVGIARLGIIGLTAAMTAASGASLTLTGRLIALRAAVIGLTRAWVPALVLTISVRGAGEAIDAINRARKAAGFNAEQYIKDLGGNALPTAVLVQKQKENTKRLRQMTQQANRVDLRPQDVDPGAPGFSVSRDSGARALTQSELRVARLELQAIEDEIARRKGKQAQAPSAKRPGFQDPTGQGSPDKEADKRRRLAEQLAAEQQRLRETAAQQEIRLADEVFRHQIELDNRRHERQKQLADIRARTEIAGLTPAQRGVAGVLQAIRQGGVEDNDRIRQAQQELAQAQRELANARRMAAVTGQGISASGGSIAGFNQQQLNSATMAAAKFTGVANMCSESVKAFYKSLGISLPGVTAWADTVRKTGTVMRDWSKLKPGDIVATGKPGDTPHVGVYTGNNNVFHQSRSRGLRVGNFPDLDYFKSGYFVRPAVAGGRTPTGVAAQQRRNVVAQGNTAVEEQRVRNAEATLRDAVAGRSELNQARINQIIAEYVQPTDDSTRSLRENTQQLKDRTRYTLEGYRPEEINGMVERNKLDREYAEIKAQLNVELEKAKENPEEQAYLNKLLQERTDAYRDNVQALSEQTAAQIESLNALVRFKEEFNQLTDLQSVTYSLGKSIETSISGAISTSVTNIATGSANIKQSLSEMFASIGKAFIDMAAQIIAKQLVIIALNSIAMVFGGGSSASGGTGLNIGDALKYSSPVSTFANGGIMTESGPLPLKRYADGGVAKTPQVALFGERGPEAYVPLPDGRSIPVAMKIDRRAEALDRYRPAPSGGTTSNGTEQLGSSPTSGTANGPIDVRYTVERINSVDYVTADQFQRGMAQAAQQGASQGERRALAQLRQNTSVRRRVGI